MESLFQQEGSLGTIILLISLLVGLLYVLMPFFIWRIWYWSVQNTKNLQKMNINLELLIRDIAPDALPPVEAPEEPKEEASEETTAGETEEGDEDLFSEDSFDDDLSADESLGFSMSDEFDDLSADLAESKISDFTDETSDDLAESDLGEEAGEVESDDDELVMDFDDESEDAAEEDFFSEKKAVQSDEAFESDRDPSGFAFPREEGPVPSKITVSEDESSDFTVEHFESNEEKSFEFEDVDDKPFSGENDTFPGMDASADESKDTAGDASATDDIWGEEAATPAKTASANLESSSDTASDFGSAFDEPEKGEESVGDVANSFLSGLEDKLNLDSFTEKPAPSPEPPPAPAPDPTPAPEPKEEPAPAESQATLFARCEGCGHKLAYKQALSGKRVRCPACRTAFALP